MPSDSSRVSSLVSPFVLTQHRKSNAQSEYLSRLAAEGCFAMGHWSSRTAWERRGYTPVNTAIPVFLEYGTARYTSCYLAFHACDVVIKPGVWKKMLRACGFSECKPTLSNRKLVYASLISAGQKDLAWRLEYSFVSRYVWHRDHSHLEWLKQRTESALAERDAAADAYTAVWEPIFEARRMNIKRRKLIEILRRLGATVDPTASLEDLGTQLDVAREEQNRPMVLAELRELGVTTESLPVGIPPREMLSLMKYGGYLCTIPYGLDLGSIRQELEQRNKVLAIWAFDHFPERVEISRCIRTPERSKVQFRRPTRIAEPPQIVQQQPVRRLPGRNNRVEMPAKVNWLKEGF